MSYREELIASRATHAVQSGIKPRQRFYKSYIRGLKLTSYRYVDALWNGSDAPVAESDYKFKYRDEFYQLTEDRKMHFSGIYTLTKITQEEYERK